MEENKVDSRKFMKVSVVDIYGKQTEEGFRRIERLSKVNKGEFNNLDLHREVPQDEFEYALAVIYTFMVNREINNVDVDLVLRNNFLRPRKEMTIDEISDALDCNVTIIGNKNQNTENALNIPDFKPDVE